jgi:hypothetical protein
MSFANGLWYHATSRRSLASALAEGVKPRRLLSEGRGHHPAHLVDPDVVYLWPKLAQAIEYGCQHDQPAILACSGLDPALFAPNDECLSPFVGDFDYPYELRERGAEELFGAEVRRLVVNRYSPASRREPWTEGDYHRLPCWRDAFEYLGLLPAELKARMAVHAADTLGHSVTYAASVRPQQLRLVSSTEIEVCLAAELERERPEREIDEEQLTVYLMRFAPQVLNALPDGGQLLRERWSWASEHYSFV